MFVMHLDDYPIGTAGHRSQTHGADQARAAGTVGRVDDDRQMGQFLYGRHRTEVKGVAGIGLECADAPLAQN